MPDLAVIIVTWNVQSLIAQALQSLLDDVSSSGLTADVYVVDSASSDDTVEIVARDFPQVHLTASKENLGFGKANNLGLRQIGFGTDVDNESLPRAVYLLNPDTITHPGATRALYDALMAEPKVGLVGAQLFYEDGTFQDGAFGFPGLRQLWTEFFPTPGRFIVGRFNGRYPRALYEAGHPFPVDFPLGATMMLKREVIQQTGMFDESFFMYCEEIDWAWRIHKAGWQVKTVPQAHVTHLVGQSTSQVRARSFVNLWESRLRLFGKHYPAWKRWFACQMVAIGINRKKQQFEQLPDATEREALVEACDAIYKMAKNA